MTPERSVIVCTTPRSGSGLLCEMLWRSDVVGRPNEWYSAGIVERAREQWGVTTQEAHLERLFREGTTPNGVFSMKFHWDHWGRFGELTDELPGRGTVPMDDLDAVFPRVRYVRLRRLDTVRQAVSRYRQRLTGITRTGDERRRPNPLEYDFGEIDSFVHRIATHNRKWDEYMVGRDPIELTYEDDVATNRERTLRRLSEELKLEISLPDGTETARRKLADELSESWVRRYREDAGLV